MLISKNALKILLVTLCICIHTSRCDDEEDDVINPNLDDVISPVGEIYENKQYEADDYSAVKLRQSRMDEIHSDDSSSNRATKTPQTDNINIKLNKNDVSTGFQSLGFNNIQQVRGQDRSVGSASRNDFGSLAVEQNKEEGDKLKWKSFYYENENDDDFSENNIQPIASINPNGLKDDTQVSNSELRNEDSERILETKYKNGNEKIIPQKDILHSFKNFRTKIKSNDKLGDDKDSNDDTSQEILEEDMLDQVLDDLADDKSNTEVQLDSSKVTTESLPTDFQIPDDLIDDIHKSFNENDYSQNKEHVDNKDGDEKPESSDLHKFEKKFEKTYRDYQKIDGKGVSVKENVRTTQSNDEYLDFNYDLEEFVKNLKTTPSPLDEEKVKNNPGDFENDLHELSDPVEGGDSISKENVNDDILNTNGHVSNEDKGVQIGVHDVTGNGESQRHAEEIGQELKSNEKEIYGEVDPKYNINKGDRIPTLEKKRKVNKSSKEEDVSIGDKIVNKSGKQDTLRENASDLKNDVSNVIKEYNTKYESVDIVKDDTYKPKEMSNYNGDPNSDDNTSKEADDGSISESISEEQHMEESESVSVEDINKKKNDEIRIIESSDLTKQSSKDDDHLIRTDTDKTEDIEEDVHAARNIQQQVSLQKQSEGSSASDNVAVTEGSTSGENESGKKKGSVTYEDTDTVFDRSEKEDKTDINDIDTPYNQLKAENGIVIPDPTDKDQNDNADSSSSDDDGSSARNSDMVREDKQHQVQETDVNLQDTSIDQSPEELSQEETTDQQLQSNVNTAFIPTTPIPVQNEIVLHIQKRASGERNGSHEQESGETSIPQTPTEKTSLDEMANQLNVVTDPNINALPSREISVITSNNTNNVIDSFINEINTTDSTLLNITTNDADATIAFTPTTTQKGIPNMSTTSPLSPVISTQDPVTSQPETATTTTLRPVSTTHVDPCAVNPCQNNGSCFAITGSNNFTCICLSNIYTGAYCEDIVDPCVESPCPALSTCVRNDTNRICVCSGNVKGDNCNETDELVICKEHVNVQHLLTGGSTVVCFPSVLSSSSNVCYDPEDDIVYGIQNDPSALFTLSANASHTCLEVKSLAVPPPSVCVNISASEKDDIKFRPMRKTSFETCVTFNEAPRISQLSHQTYNLNDKTEGDAVFILSEIDNFGSGQTVWSILNISPAQYYSDFNITKTGTVVLENISKVPSSGINVTFTIQVIDGGVPPLNDSVDVVVLLLDVSIRCSIPKEIYVQLPWDKTQPIADIICETNSTATKTFQILESSGLEIKVDNRGRVFLPQISSTVLQAGSRLIRTKISSANNVKTEVEFKVIMGDFTPKCRKFVVRVPENVADNVCFYVLNCSNPNQENWNCENSFGNSNISAYVTTNCSDDNILGNIVVGFCVTQSLIGNNMLGPHEFRGSVSNIYGTTNVTTTIEVSNVEEPPRFTISSHTTTISETAIVGTSVLLLVAKDPDPNEVLVYSINNASIPFGINQAGEVSTNAKLNSTDTSIYTFMVTVTDKSGLEDVATVVVTVDDVNQPPFCSHAFGTYVITVNATLRSGYKVGQVNCYDVDKNIQFRTFRFVFNNNTAQDVLGLLNLTSKGELILKQDMTTSSSQYDFAIQALDDGGLSTTTNISIVVNRNFPPACVSSVFRLNISEKVPFGTCQEILTDCTDPLGGTLHFKAAGNNRDFDILDANNSTLIICSKLSLDRKYGLSQMDVIVNNSFAITTITLEINIQDENDRPQFRNPVYTFNVSEKATVQTLIGQVQANDPDSSVNAVTGYSFETPTGVFSVDNTGRIQTQQNLNASKLAMYKLQLKATDAGGLTAITNLTINVVDENDPPICGETMLRVDINLTTPSGSDVGYVDCVDWDLAAPMKTIVYNSQDRQNIFSLRSDGILYVARDIPRSLRDYSFEIVVRDKFMENSGTTSGQVLIDVFVNVDRDISPECSETLITGSIPETQVGGCLGKEVTCIDPTGGTINMKKPTGSGTALMEVKSRSTTVSSLLPLNLCVKSSIKNQTGTFEVNVEVYTDLGSTPIRFTFDIKDVNEPPVFIGGPYQHTISEKAPVGQRVFVLTVVDPDREPKFSAFNITSTMIGDQTYRNIQLLQNTFYVTGRLNATVKHQYQFDMNATDNGGLFGSSSITFNITDVNEVPICLPTSYTFSTTILAPIDKVLGQILCYDTDKEADFRRLLYTSSSNLFRFNEEGTMFVAGKFPRLQTSHNIRVDVSDGGTPPETTSVTVLVNTDNNIPVDCKPNTTYPAIWVKGQCVFIDMNCTDPTLNGTSHLTYSETGNFGLGFDMTRTVPGGYQFCYKKLVGGAFSVVITVDNNLMPYSKQFPLDVVYEQSTPQFSSAPYAVTVSESTPRSSIVINVMAVSGSAQGNIIYNLIDQGSFTNWNAYFTIDESSGRITVVKGNLRDLSTQEVRLTVQATNDFSSLKSTTTVTISVTDLNEPPVCSFTNGAVIWKVDLAVNHPFASIIENITCSDPDIKAENKDLNFNLAVSPTLRNTYFTLADTADSNKKELRIANPLSVTQAQYILNITVSDRGSPSQSTVLQLVVQVNLLPPLPILEAVAVNSSTVEVKWKYDRVDFFDVTSSFIIKATSSGGINSFTAPSDVARARLMILYLNPETTYSISLLAVTNYGNVSARAVQITTPAIPRLSTFVVSVKMTGEVFSSRLYDNGSFAYVTLSDKVKSNARFVLMSTPGFVDIAILSFRPGSVIVDAAVTLNQTGNINDTINTLQSTVSTGWIGNISVDPAYYIHGQGAGYIKISSLVSNVTTALNDSSVLLSCNVDVVGKTGVLSVQWFLNNIRIKPPPSSRFSIMEQDTTSSFRRQFTLVFSPIKTRDAGVYACKVNDTSGLFATSSLQVDVVSQPKLNLHPVTRTVNEGESVDISCLVLSPTTHSVTFTWFVQGNQVTGREANIGIMANGNYEEVLTLRSVTEKTKVSCVARNIAGDSRRLNSVVHVLKAASKSCPSNTDNKGTTWDMTVEGGYDIKNCSAGFEGDAIRYCLPGGRWDAPVYDSCTRIDFQLVFEESQQLREGVQNQTSENILGELARLTQENTDLYAANLDVAVGTLDNCVQLARDDDDTITDKSLENFLDSVSNLLDETHIVEWEKMILKDLKGASQLMKAVTEYGKVSSKKKKQLTRIEKKNLFVEVGQISSSDITFPSKVYPSWLQQESASKVMVNKATFDGISADSSQPVGFSTTYYRNMSDLLHKYLYKNGELKNINNTIDVNSAVIDVSFDPIPNALNPPIRLELQHFSTNYSNPLCGFWDFTIPGTPNGAWSTEGCVMISSTETMTICECSHTTNFAILMSPGITPSQHVLALSIISAVGCAVSFVFLLITVIIYGIYWRYVKSDRSIILMNLCVALIISYAIFLGGVNRTEIEALCTTIAALLHFILLVVFFLMLAEGIEMAISILYVFSTRSRAYWLVPLSWILPAIIVAISLGVTNLDGYGNDSFCWLSIKDGQLYAFIGPALAIVVTNFVILFLVLRAMFSSHTMLTKSSKEQAKCGLRSMCVILPVIGVTWVLGVFSVNDELVIFQYLFAIFNSLQGLFIFLFHCLFNRQIKDAMNHSRRRKRSLAGFQTKSTSQTSQKVSKKDNLDIIQNDIEQDKNKKGNPFREADEQVKQMVDKLRQGESNNAFNGVEKDKIVEKDNIVSIDDIKISNLMRDNGTPQDVPAQEEISSNSSRNRSIESSKNSSKHDSYPLQYEKLQSFKDSSSSPYTPLQNLQGSENRSSSQKSSSSNETQQKRPVGQKLSSSSSNARVSTGTGSTYVDLYNPTGSGSSYGYVEQVSGLRQSTKASRSADDLEYQSKEPRGGHRGQQYVSKPRHGSRERDRSSKKDVFYRGKAKDVAAAKKQQPRKDSKKSQDRSRSHDRSYQYAVDYYGGAGIPQRPHGSLENVSMQYLGFQPYGGIRGQVQMPNEMWDYSMQWQDARRDPRRDYW